MAADRPVQTFYGRTTRRTCNEGHHHARGRAATLVGAVAAATRRLLALEFNRCDIYHSHTARHVYTIVRVGKVVTIQQHPL
jgi:hypothetical protein